MKFSSKLLAVAVIAVTTYSMTSCSAPSTYSYKNVSIALTSFCVDCTGGVAPNFTIYNPAFPQPPNPGSVILMANAGEGNTATFVATVTNAPSTNVTWTVYPQGNLSDIDTLPSGTSTPVGESGNPSGTIQAASGNTVYYTIPGVPIYSGAALVQANQLGIPQGDLLLVAAVPIDPANPSAEAPCLAAPLNAGCSSEVATQTQIIQTFGGSSQIGPPSTYLTPHSLTSPANQTQAVVTVPHGTSYAFYGGTVGAGPCTSTTTCGTGVPVYTVDNSSVWEVGPTPFSLATAVAGGNSTLGTITSQGVYTAPTVIPTGGEVVVIVTSHLAPTVATYAYVGIN